MSSVHFCLIPPLRMPPFSFFFFFNDTATTEIYTLSLHDALPISNHPFQKISLLLDPKHESVYSSTGGTWRGFFVRDDYRPDRKSTRLNSSHQIISYAVFCLKKKKKGISAKSVILQDYCCYNVSQN